MRNSLSFTFVFESNANWDCTVRNWPTTATSSEIVAQVCEISSCRHDLLLMVDNLGEYSSMNVLFESGRTAEYTENLPLWALVITGEASFW